MTPNLKKKRYLLVVILAVFGILLGFLPFFLSTDPVLRFAVAEINSRIPGKLTVGSWLIGWQQGVLCQDITYVNPEQGVRLSVPRLTTTRGILELILSRKNFGQIALDSPVVVLAEQNTEKGSPGTAGTAEAGSAVKDEAPFWEHLTVRVEVRGGQVRMVSAKLEREAGIKDIVLHSSLDKGVVQFDAGFHMINQQGSVSLNGSMNLPARKSSFLDTLVTEAQVTVAGLQIKDFLAVAALQANVPRGQGIVSSDVKIKASGLDNLEFSGTADVADLELDGGVLGEDSPTFRNIHVDINRASLSKLRWSLEHLLIESDAGTIEAASRHDSGKTTYSGRGNIIIPVLFDQFPHLLKLQESTLIENGELSFESELAVSNEKMAIDFTGNVFNLGGLYNGQPFSWDRPMTVVVAGDRKGSELNVSRFRIEAPFVRATGKGNLSAFDLEARADLDQAFEELGKLFRLKWSGSGKMNMAVNASALRAREDRYRINADFSIDDFSLRTGERVVIPAGNLSLVGSGHAPVSMLHEKTGSVDLQFALSSWLGEIFLALDANKDKTGSWSGSYSTDTNINLSDVAAFMHLVKKLPPATSFSGDVLLQASGNFNDAYLGIRELETDITGLVLNLDGIAFEDHDIELQIERSVNDEVSSLVVQDLVVVEDRDTYMAAGAGMTGINFKDHSLSVHDVILDAQRGNVDVKRLVIQDWTNPLEKLSSDFSVSADLSGLSPLLQGAGLLAAGIDLSGMADVHFDAAGRDNGEHDISTEIQLDGLGISRDGKDLLTGEDAEFSARLVGRLASNNFELKKFMLSSAPLELDGHGLVTRTEGGSELELQGNLSPDLAAVSALVRSGFDIDLTMTGQERETFSVHLPIGPSGDAGWKDKTTITASISAESIAYRGIDVQALHLPIRFANSNLHLAAAGRMNEGRINLVTDCDFRDEPPVIVIPGNSRVLTAVRLEKPLVEGLLKGIHPIFGVLTRPSGKIDVRLDTFTWPLNQQGGKDAVFEAVIDTSEVSLDSSTLLKTILARFGLEQEQLLLRDSNVVCSGRDGRITCSPVRILAADSEMVLSGSIGMDRSLDYLLQIPVTRKLVGREGYRVLEGTTINVPIKGTADNPVFDGKLLAAAIQDLLKQAASRALIDQAGKVLPELIDDILKTGDKRK